MKPLRQLCRDFFYCKTVRTLFVKICAMLFLRQKKPKKRGRRKNALRPYGATGKGVRSVAKKSYRFINSKEKNEFLNYYIQLGTISAAAKEAKISRQTHYDWLKNDKRNEYHRAFAQAEKMAADLLEEEAWRRAVTGDLRVVYYKGENVGEQRVYSDQLLALLLKGRKPQYKESAEINASVTVNMSEAVGAARRRVESGVQDEK